MVSSIRLVPVGCKAYFFVVLFMYILRWVSVLFILLLFGLCILFSSLLRLVLLVDFRGKGFCVVSSQRHVPWMGLRLNIYVGVVCVMFFVSFIFYFPRVFVQDDHL